MHRSVYYISDGTGISAETLGHSLMTQFGQIDFAAHTLPYINSKSKAEEAVAKINESFDSDQNRPIVFSTIVKPEIRNIIAHSKAFVIDFFQTFIGPLEKALNTTAHPAVGLSHAVTDVNQYTSRIDAVNFVLQCDDGLYPSGYNEADIILIGVSRSGKTPTCLYLALQYAVKAANYPLTEEDFQKNHLPSSLESHHHRLFGLTISPERLHDIRSKRKPNSRYASLEQCKEEIQLSEKLFHKERIPYLNSTHLSIEELSTQILIKFGLR